MSGLRVALTTSQPLGTGDTTRKTILAYTAPGNTGARVRRVSISFSGTSPTAGKIQVYLTKGFTGGTSTSRTPVKVGGHTGSVQGGGAENFTGEPSGGVDAFGALVHPQSGYDVACDICLNPGERAGLVVLAPAAVNAVATMDLEE